jgi:hypothetical protein
MQYSSLQLFLNIFTCKKFFSSKKNGIIKLCFTNLCNDGFVGQKKEKEDSIFGVIQQEWHLIPFFCLTNPAQLCRMWLVQLHFDIFIEC